MHKYFFNKNPGIAEDISLIMGAYSTFVNELARKFLLYPDNKTARDIISHYFEFIDVKDIHQELWELTVGLLTNDEFNESAKGRDRLNVMYFFEFTKLFVEAVHTLYQPEKRKRRTKRKKSSKSI